MGMLILRWGKKNNRKDYQEIENHLESVFLPQPPRPEFVANLHQRLLHELDNPPLDPRLDPRRLVLITAASLLGGTVLLVMGIRTVVTILAGLGLLHKIETTRSANLAKRTAPG